MRTAFFSIAALVAILPALAAPANIPISKFAGPVKANSYIMYVLPILSAFQM